MYLAMVLWVPFVQTLIKVYGFFRQGDTLFMISSLRAELENDLGQRDDGSGVFPVLMFGGKGNNVFFSSLSCNDCDNTCDIESRKCGNP